MIIEILGLWIGASVTLAATFAVACTPGRRDERARERREAHGIAAARVHASK